MATSQKSTDLKSSELEKNEEKITTALSQLRKQGLTLRADIVLQVRKEAQKQGLYDIDSIKKLARTFLAEKKE